MSQLNTLLLQNPHYSHFNTSTPSHSIYYTYQNLSYCLRRFQEDIIKDDSEENKIRLGDTCHLAMISLIASGGSPVICKELAGHENINISAHYYFNISRFVECATYEMYKKRNHKYVDLLSHKPVRTGETAEVAGGLCDSPAYIAGSISECIRSMGAGGELDMCVSCPHFIDGKSGLHL